MPDRPSPAIDDWWRDAVVYEIYIRSFADGDGDGIGDIAGIRDRLLYLAWLGVDALWITPWYPSPMNDGGYDVADPRQIEPLFGTLAAAKAMIAEAHELGLRVLLDIVPNHFSSNHAWFPAALAAAPGSSERARFIFRPGRGHEGALPPNDWVSLFGGPAWTRTVDRDGGAGEWYLHLFAPDQPDLNWTNEDVLEDFDETIRFWFDRGVDGFRVDVAHGLAKAPGLPDVGDRPWPPPPAQLVDHPHWDRDEIHPIFRRWRRLADSYDPPRVFVAEAWVGSEPRLARYVRHDELHTAFNFDFLMTPWLSDQLTAEIQRALDAHAEVGAPPTWVLSNHDVIRVVSRFARPQGVKRLRHLDDALELPADFAVGRRRAAAGALLMLALPGGAYIYTGEELGLAEVEDLPDDALRDPTYLQSGRTLRGRDGCRVPMPWSGAEPPFSFSPPDATAPPWLPQPAAWRAFTVEAQTGHVGSMLELYRAALRLRRGHPALGAGTLQWLPAPDHALAFCRDPGFRCVVNLSAPAFALPDSFRVILASGELTAGGELPPDIAVWLTDAAD